MKVLALIESPGHVCYRYRIAAFLSALEGRKIEVETVSLEGGTLGRTGRLARARQFDVVLLQRRLLPGWQVGLLRRMTRRLVFDLDDAVFQRDGTRGRPMECSRRARRFRQIVQACDAVIAGNDYLAAKATFWTGPGRVQRIPTCVEPAGYGLARHERTGAEARLVWIGSSSTLHLLKRGEADLAAAGRRLAGLELRLICDAAESFDALQVKLRPWSEETETSDLADGDIGISWLPDDSWSRGKCGLKVLQYMAAGLPVVANPIGVTAELVTDGETGLLASTSDEWAAAIDRLANDPGLRRRMGAAGRRRVEEEYSPARWGDVLADVLEGAAGAESSLPSSAES